jgi:hypothetical protein
VSRRRPRAPARRRSGGYSRRALLAGLFGAAAVAAPRESSAFTTGRLGRGSRLPVADDAAALLALDVEPSVAGGTWSPLVTVTNRFDAAAVVTLSTATGTLRTDDAVGGAVTATLAPAAAVTVDVEPSGTDGDPLPFVVEATVDGTTLWLRRESTVAGGGPPAPPAPVARWPFDELVGRTTPEVVGGRDLTASGNVRLVPGLIGAAVEFRGNASLDRVDALLDGRDAFTLGVHVRSDRTGYDGGVVAATDGRGDPGVLLRYAAEASFTGGATDVLRAEVRVGDDLLVVESGAGHQTTDWQHLAVTWASGEPLRLYVDGQPVEPAFVGFADGTPATGTPPAGTTTGAGRLRVGKTGHRQRWDGRIDDLRVFDRRLSDTEVARLAADRPSVTRG